MGRDSAGANEQQGIANLHQVLWCQRGGIDATVDRPLGDLDRSGCRAVRHPKLSAAVGIVPTEISNVSDNGEGPHAESGLAARSLETCFRNDEITADKLGGTRGGTVRDPEATIHAEHGLGAQNHDFSD